mgnify:CR=1 FL=1
MSIDSLTTKAGGSATVSGSAVYDSVTEGLVSFDSGQTQTISTSPWNLTQSLKPGQHTVTATVGSASVSQSFGVGSNEGGLHPCQLAKPTTCPMYGFTAPFVPEQETGSVNVQLSGLNAEIAKTNAMINAIPKTAKNVSFLNGIVDQINEMMRQLWNLMGQKAPTN